MVADRQLTFDDYMRMMRRRVWVILIPAILAPVIAYLISLVVPERYTSQTLVLIEQPRVPDNFVKPVVTDDLNQRLQTMREQILSRTRLQPIIDRFGLYKKDKDKGASVEELIERMRKAITIQTVRPESSRSGVPGFYISFTADNARMAQQVCAEITSMFMQENLLLRERHAEGTTDFLRGQLEESKRKLDEQDQKLASFKQRYVGQLPGQEQTNMNLLMGLNTQLEAATQALSRARQDKSFAESMLAQQIAEWKAQRSPESPKATDDTLQKLQADLVSAESRYTSDHPDVIKLKKEIELLRQKQQKQQANDSPDSQEIKPSAPEPAPIQRLRISIHQLDEAAREKTKDQERLQAEVRKYEARVQLSPIVEEQYKQLTRDYQTALNFYTDLLNKKTQSEMATDLERKQQGEQFRIMDPPNLPEKPIFPNRPLMALGGLAVGLGLGFGIAFLLEMRNRAIQSEDDVTFYLELPTLAMVPVVGGNGRRSAKPGRARAAAKATPMQGRA